jgi:hypothetical protein
MQHVKKSLSGLVMLSALIGAAATAAPAEPVVHEAVPAYSGWASNVFIGQWTLDSETAKKEGVGTSAVVFGLNGEYYFGGKNQSLQFGGGFLSYDDKNDFSVETEGVGWANKGDKSTESSSASAIFANFEYGVRHRFGPHKGGYVAGRGGFNALFASERSISNCTDCPSQDIDISGGFYGVAAVGFNFTRGFSMDLDYKQFFSGDIKNGIALNFRWVH